MPNPPHTPESLGDGAGPRGDDEMTPRPPALVSLADYLPAVHFVGFRGEEYWSAVRVWGLPDFYHRGWDQRARREIADGDTVMFGPKADPSYVSPYTYDDSNEADDPAALERLRDAQ